MSGFLRCGTVCHSGALLRCGTVCHQALCCAAAQSVTRRSAALRHSLSPGALLRCGTVCHQALCCAAAQSVTRRSAALRHSLSPGALLRCGTVYHPSRLAQADATAAAGWAGNSEGTFVIKRLRVHQLCDKSSSTFILCIIYFYSI